MCKHSGLCKLSATPELPQPPHTCSRHHMQVHAGGLQSYRRGSIDRTVSGGSSNPAPPQPPRTCSRHHMQVHAGGLQSHRRGSINRAVSGGTSNPAPPQPPRTCSRHHMRYTGCSMSSEQRISPNRMSCAMKPSLGSAAGCARLMWSTACGVGGVKFRERIGSGIALVGVGGGVNALDVVHGLRRWGGQLKGKDR